MVTFSVGSVANAVQERVSDIPVSISGATLHNIADMSRIFVEVFTGDTIGSLAIAERYQPALIDLTASNLLKFMELEGVDVANIRLGDLSISKGATSSASVISAALKDSGMRKLAEIGHDVRFFQAL